MTPEAAHAFVCRRIVERQMPGLPAGTLDTYVSVLGPPALTRLDDGSYVDTARFLAKSIEQLTVTVRRGGHA